MKNPLKFSWLLLFVCISLQAQIQPKKKTAVTLIQQRQDYLNGRTRSSFEGHSRITLKVDLPANTKSWYYSFSTAPGESGVANLNLAIQLSTLLMQPSIPQTLVEGLRVPEGTTAIDVYLTDQPNGDAFLRKYDLNGGNFNYFREGSVLGTKQAIVEVDDITTGTVYLGLNNPTYLNGINVAIEVVALVEELDDSQVQAVMYGNLGWKAFENGEYDRCLELSQKALSLDGDLAYVHFNIGIVYLVKGLNDQAMDEYTKAVAMTRKMSANRPTFEGAVQDLKKYMLLFSSQTSAHEILDLLDMELQTAK